MLNYSEYASSAPHFLRYVVIPGSLAFLFLLAGFLARPKLAMAVGIYGLSALLGLFLFEALLTFRSVPVRLAMLGQLDENERQALEQKGYVVSAFTLNQLNRMSDVDNLPEAILSGFPKTEVVLCAPENNAVIYRSDRFGFNNPDEVYDRGSMNAMLLGDSFVEGFCLPPGDDIASRLRNDRVAVTAAGIRGNGPLVELATLGRFGPILRPDHVLMVFFEGNDWENLENELRMPWLRAALDMDADYGSPSNASDSLHRARAAIEQRNKQPVTVIDLLTKTALLRNFAALQQTLTRLGLVLPRATPEIPEFRMILHRAKTIANSWGGTFTLVYVPRVDRFMGALRSRAAFDPLRTLVLDSAVAEGIEVIDLVPPLEEHPEPEKMYAADSHFNRDGAAFAADIVAKRLRGPALSKAASAMH
ncbi:SGNH/GDSL hydrolase family protein [Sinorhizobium garamanticum]|uniref:SGNH/GDSL hydrolase family protein n=2 Tax=Sinorhizobium garamanticum TaxID=680247 RepID=A0ABY8DF13_9HYPH|nr:SGNH/GDSL hydrolase family protein [Sinorhizobium garamanticum]WEX89476.1 SGNH/GDSL hydrolase family protein [Sinorhizobium garamanticum]